MFAALQETVEWSSDSGPEAATWHERLATIGPWIALAALCFFAGRAWLHRKRYTAVGALATSDIDALHEAVRAAETRTVGEIVPVIVERSDDHPHAGWLAALVFVGAGSALLEPHLPWDHPALVLAAQAALAVLGWALAKWSPSFARLYVSESRATHTAEEQAAQEFHLLELHRTEAQTGVLIFVSLFERRVIVLADRGVNSAVGPEHWDAVDRAVLDGIRAGSLRDGLLEGIRLTGDVLAQHFPSPDGGRNQLPDRVIVRAR